MRPYRDDDNEQYRRGFQRRWQDDMHSGARPRRSQGYAEDRYPGDRYSYSYSYGGERDRERYGNPLERYSYEEPWRMPSPYRLRRSGWDDEGYRPAYDEEFESSGLGSYRRSSGERSERGFGSSSERGFGERGYSQGGERESSYDRRRGPYRGRGPKGYRRSDEAIREDISQRLEEHGQIDASEIEVTVRDGTVTLKGVVDERWTKRLAEDIAEDVNGVRDVENHLRVDQSFFERQQQQSQQQGAKRGQESSRQV